MEVQSLSIQVPGGCPNMCKFCVSQMRDKKSPYRNLIENDFGYLENHYNQYLRRLAFARDNGCNTAILTGEGEPVINTRFLESFSLMNRGLSNPFKWIEIQTSGVTLDVNKLNYLRDHVGISTIALSLSSLSSDVNAEINCFHNNHRFNINELCGKITEAGFNLRLCLNMNDWFHRLSPSSLFDEISLLGANQVTFRKLFLSGLPSAKQQDMWIEEHQYMQFLILNKYIEDNGRPLEILPFGAMRYSVNGISTVIDYDCMSTETKPVIRYLILRPNCRLYTKWDDSGSLLF